LVLKKWGLSDSEIENRFGWFIEALSYGTPQHAGFAIGIDRLVAEVMKQHSIRDVIPFPKTQSGMDPLTDAPTTLDADLLEEYNLKVIDDNE
jgi:aspartyl-tRNA synthetase